jgi:hypothetical protein
MKKLKLNEEAQNRRSIITFKIKEKDAVEGRLLLRLKSPKKACPVGAKLDIAKAV